jgi:hypothetical protein
VRSIEGSHSDHELNHNAKGRNDKKNAQKQHHYCSGKGLFGHAAILPDYPVILRLFEHVLQNEHNDTQGDHADFEPDR